MFDTAHLRRLAALGAPRITVVDLLAPEPSDGDVIEAQMLAALA